MSKIVLITGASSGIGKTTAIELKKKGYTVYGVSRNLQKLKELQDLGINIYELDISNQESLEKCFNYIIDKEKKIDILINNAGLGVYGSIEETEMKDARYQFEVNLFGLARLTQLVIPVMRSQKSGHIINISSIAGKLYLPLSAWYHATKYALEGWSDTLRVEMKNFGIKVTIIEPGIISTNFGKNVYDSFAERSSMGPYKNIYKKMKNNFNKIQGSEPIVISNLIIKAIESSNPSTRYSGGKFAKLFLFLRKIVPDKFYDKMVLR